MLAIIMVSPVLNCALYVPLVITDCGLRELTYRSTVELLYYSKMIFYKYYEATMMAWMFLCRETTVLLTNRIL